jgi:hypothetical protein
MNAKDTLPEHETETNGSSGGAGSDEDASEGADVEQLRTRDVGPLSLDETFELLKNARRRIAIQHLRGADGEVTLSDLAEHVAAVENDTTPEGLTSSERKRVYVGLYQCHLPKMDELDAVEFDRDRGLVELGPNVGQLVPYLEADDDGGGRNWPAYYLAVGGGGFALYAASVVSGSTLLTAGVTHLVTLVALVALSVAHLRSDRPDGGDGPSGR